VVNFYGDSLITGSHNPWIERGGMASALPEPRELVDGRAIINTVLEKKIPKIVSYRRKFWSWLPDYQAQLLNVWPVCTESSRDAGSYRYYTGTFVMLLFGTVHLNFQEQAGVIRSVTIYRLVCFICLGFRVWKTICECLGGKPILQATVQYGR
jgi:hypothetical protein